MPQAPEELRAEWGDDKAIRFLEAAGYVLTRNWEWELPSPGHVPTAKELSAISYLFHEWDFGGIADDKTN